MMMEGIITPIVTPFNRDDNQSINIQATGQLIDHLIDHGVQGIFILGSNGEFHVIDEDEKIAFIRNVVALVHKRVPVYAGTGACSTKATIRLSQRAQKEGVDALSIITPYFIKPSSDDLYAHYKEIAQSVQIPIMLYNIPQTTGCSLDPQLVDALSDIENILGIKDSSGDPDTLKAYASIAKKKNIRLLVGSDSKISYAYGLGAVGAVAGTSNVIVDTLVALDKALRTGDQILAANLQQDIDVLRAVIKLKAVPSVMKRAVELAGIAPVGPSRKPLQEVGLEVDEKIKVMLKHYHLIG